MIFAYIDNNKNNISEVKQRDILDKYAKSNRYEIDFFLNSENQTSILSHLNSENNLFIATNLLALGYSLKDIKKQIEFLNSKKISIHVIEDDLDINAEKNAIDLTKALDIAIKIRSNIVSTSTKIGIQRRVEKGLKTGRPYGSINKYAQNQLGADIEDKLRLGTPILNIAKDLSVSVGTVYNYLRSHPDIEDNRKVKSYVINNQKRN